MQIPRGVRIAVAGALCFAALLPGLGRQTMARQQELRVALAARQMAQGGSWLVPRFEGAPRFNKPPLMYWVVAATFRLAGTTRSAFVARIPGVVFGVGLLGAVYAAGAQWANPIVGGTAAALVFSSFLFQRHARLAETDMPLSLCTLLSILSIYRALHRERSARAWAAAGFWAGVGFLFKGPGAFAIPALTTLAFALPDRERRLRLRGGNLVLAVAICLAVAAPWYWVVHHNPALHDSLEHAVEEEVGALFVRGSHPGPWWYYVYKLPVAALPWGPLLPLAIAHVALRRRREPGPFFALTWFTTAFLLLSLLHNKQDHYNLLLLPPAALLAGIWLVHVSGRTSNGQRRLARFLAGSAVAVVAAAQAYVFCLYPRHRPESLIPDFARKAEPWIRQAGRLFVTGARTSAFEFYAGRTVQVCADAEAAWRNAAPGDGVAVLFHREDAPEAARLPASPVLDLRRGALRCVLLVKP